MSRSATAQLEAAPPWMARWPRSHPRVKGAWTLTRPGSWATLEPETGKIVAATPERDKRLPGLATALAGGGRLVGYRVGRRAIVASGERWTKVVRPSKVAALAATHQDLAAALGSRGIAAPEVLGVHGDGRLELTDVSGPSLHETIRSIDVGSGAGARDGFDDGFDDEGLVAALTRLAGALARFHRLPAPIGADERFPDRPAAGIALVARAEPAAVADLRRAATGLPPLPPTGPLVLVHGDLHDKNVIRRDDGGIGLIDLDQVGRGRAEDEVANLAVHLELRALQAGQADGVGRRWSHRFVDAYRAAAPLDEARLDAAARHTWFRLACLYRYRRSGRALTGRLLGRAVDDR